MSANPLFEAANTRADLHWRAGMLDLPDPFRLESGERLRAARLAWQCVGADDAPLVIALGGISAHRRVCARDGRGWFEGQCGVGRPLDITRYRVLGIDWLGGVDGSTGPRGGESRPCGLSDTAEAGDEPRQGEFPAISTTDQARALLLLLNRLGVRRVHLLVGASYGGAVAQHLAVLLGDRLRHLALLSAAHRPSQFGLALRHVQRAILDLGADAKAALALARSLAVLGYRTPHGVEARFADSEYGEVLAWLAHHGESFSARFNAAAYRCLGASLDTHAIDPAAVRVPTTQLAVQDDLIVPLSLLREYAARAGATCELVEISSPYGHDAFLKEEVAVGRVLLHALGEQA